MKLTDQCKIFKVLLIKWLESPWNLVTQNFVGTDNINRLKKVVRKIMDHGSINGY